MPVAWVLNLDADEELRDPVGYAPSARMRERVERMQALLIATLLAPGDRIVRAGEPALGPEYTGQAWCPTPRALAALHAAGVQVPPAPPLSVLQRVNHRAFNAGLGQTLPDALFARDAAALHAHLAAHADRTWLLKRPFGFSGRGRMCVRWPVRDATHERWIARSFATGDGLQVEPWVERELDVAIHGRVHAGAPARIGTPVVQECAANGAWLRSRLPAAGEVIGLEHDVLDRTARAVASALQEAGYFGPFGVDAYRWRDVSGNVHFNPRSEINARYTMGWPIGMHV